MLMTIPKKTNSFAKRKFLNKNKQFGYSELLKYINNEKLHSSFQDMFK